MTFARHLVSAFAALLVADMARADTVSAPRPPEALQVNVGTLSRLSAAQVQEGLAVTLALDGDVPLANYVVAQFQNDQPLMLTAGGQWVPWNGDPATLADSGASAGSDTLTYAILPPAQTMFWPAAFMMAYQTSTGIKSATIVVDEVQP